MLSLSLPALLHAQEGGVIAGNAQIVLSGRVHAQVNTTSVDGETPAEIFLRRVRLGADIGINDLVSGRIHADFAGNRVSLADAYMMLSLNPAFQLVAGNAHRPFGLIEQTTSLRIVPIERGVRIRGLSGSYDLSSLLSSLDYSDRDIGLLVRGSPEGAPLGLSYSAGVFNGPLELGDEQTLQLVGRVELEPTDGITVGAAASRRDFDNGTGAEGGTALTADVRFGGSAPTPGFDILAEVATGPFDLSRDFAGAHVWVAYRIPLEGAVTRVSPLIRFSHVTVDELVGGGDVGGTLITPGFNIYLGGLNRVMFNYDIFNPASGDTETSFKTQFQLTF